MEWIKAAQIVITFCIIVVPIASETRFNPLYRRGHQALDELKQFSLSSEATETSVKRGERGFRVLLGAIEQHRRLSGTVCRIVLGTGDYPISGTGQITGSPTLAPNCSLYVEYQEEIDPEAVVYRPLSPDTTMNLEYLERWLNEYMIRISRRVEIGLAVSWVTTSLLLV